MLAVHFSWTWIFCYLAIIFFAFFLFPSKPVFPMFVILLTDTYLFRFCLLPTDEAYFLLALIFGSVLTFFLLWLGFYGWGFNCGWGFEKRFSICKFIPISLWLLNLSWSRCTLSSYHYFSVCYMGMCTWGSKLGITLYNCGETYLWSIHADRDYCSRLLLETGPKYGWFKEMYGSRCFRCMCFDDWQVQTYAKTPNSCYVS